MSLAAIGTALSIGQTLLTFSKYLVKGDKELDNAKDVIDTAASVYNVLSTNSVALTANKATIAPMVVVEQAILHQEYMHDLLNIVQLRDVANTLTHLALEGSVGGVKIASLVDSINPNRAGNNQFLCYSGSEAFGNAIAGTEAKTETEYKDGVPRVTVGGKEYAELSEYTPLALGKTVEAVTSIDGKEVKFPLTFRQITMPAPTDEIKHVFKAAKIEDGWTARVMMYRTQEITGPELLSGKDSIKERFNLKDKEMLGYYKEATDREWNNKKASLRTGLVSMNTLANAFIMSKDTAKQVELEIGLNFDSRKSLNLIFNRVKANTIVVCDEDRGVFTFYVLGGSIPERYTRNEIKSKSKKDNSVTDLTSLLKLINTGA